MYVLERTFCFSDRNIDAADVAYDILMGDFCTSMRC